MGSDADPGTPVGRRVVLGMLGLGAAGIVWGSRLADAFNRALAPIAAMDRTGLTGLLPAGRFRIYSVVGFLPRREPADYRLRVTGLVERPLELTLADLVAMRPTRLVRDFQCVTGWRVPDVAWTGVAVSDLLDAAGVAPPGRALAFRSFDGVYAESLTLDQARRPDVVVAYEMEGEPVSRAHGGPARLYVAPMYGYKSLKWLEEIEVTADVEEGYWEQRGYDADAWIGRSNGRRDEPVG
ncbi:MAG TPA: molybdopterin-dependent oxidoreductase [Acidimicrobiales bacterium]|jgi:DMSO/TMAO reductase YedYZ molybdopterin-dependent catalytic subunit|nr:molybdopterin-dependent oxidoreductase [Acidimicrobiales bacterium]